jgi:hypothetical protein
LRNYSGKFGERTRPRVQFPASRQETLFGETPNTTREDAYAPQTLPTFRKLSYENRSGRSRISCCDPIGVSGEAAFLPILAVDSELNV